MMLVGGTKISKSLFAVTPDAERRRAMSQTLLLAAGFLVLVAISAASVLLVNKARDENAWVVHTIEVENQTNTLLLEIRRAESAARGYLLTSGPEFLRDHEAAVAAIPSVLGELTALTRDNPAQAEKVKQLRAAIGTRLDQFAREMSFVRQGDAESATALVRALVLESSSKSRTS